MQRLAIAFSSLSRWQPGRTLGLRHGMVGVPFLRALPRNDAAGLGESDTHSDRHRLSSNLGERQSQTEDPGFGWSVGVLFSVRGKEPPNSKSWPRVCAIKQRLLRCRPRPSRRHCCDFPNSTGPKLVIGGLFLLLRPICRASSLVSSLAADRRPGLSG